MSYPTPHEIDAMTDAGIKGGDYLEGIGKTDLATLSHEEWMTFVEAVCMGYCDGMRRRAGAEMLRPNDADYERRNMQ